MSKLDKLKQHLHSGKVYRRSDLQKWSDSVDLHLEQLQEEGLLQEFAEGLYYQPKKTAFGYAPPKDEELVRAFLDGDDFLITSYNAYNSLGVGTTQLYNETLVYNRKRNEKVKLNGRIFDFRVKSYVPESASSEFLMVDLVDNIERLAENVDLVLNQIRKAVSSLESSTLLANVDHSESDRTKEFFAEILEDDTLVCAA
ncbi:hypothetical protein IQ255_06360 [Pleurocapsales cyanobacterium LEGE 10410]|nr:hypothetical protein [Pleurocapsales cyanobacterium LEGE 10410]